MAAIYVVTRKDPIRIANSLAKTIKAIWLGTDLTPPAPKDRQLDLGDVWSGLYGQIKSIEMDQEYKSIHAPQEYRDLTDKERERVKNRLKKVRENLIQNGTIKEV